MQLGETRLGGGWGGASHSQPRLHGGVRAPPLQTGVGQNHTAQEEHREPEGQGARRALCLLPSAREITLRLRHKGAFSVQQDKVLVMCSSPAAGRGPQARGRQSIGLILPRSQ